jgi:pyruvate, water dikinase
MTEFIRWFSELSLKDVPQVGGKNASLGELRRALGPEGSRVPDGFAITAQAYWALLDEAGLRQPIATLLAGLRPGDTRALAACGEEIRALIHDAPLPPRLWAEVRVAYEALCARSGGRDVAVRSSATAEDLPTASFAGQMESFLNIQGEAALLEAVRSCFASLFTDRAISYRIDRGFEHMGIALSIGVQRMVRSDLGASGVIFTLDTESGFRDVVLLNASYGLGETVVKGMVSPDEFFVFKPTRRQGKRPILQKRLGSKLVQMIYSEGAQTSVVPVPPEQQGRFCLSDDEVLALADIAMRIEEHYSATLGRDAPMDIEWAKDGRTGELFIVQARPETVQSRRRAEVLERYSLEERGAVLLSGEAIGQKIGAGRARVIQDASHLEDIQPGEVLVADITTPDWEPVMRKASAIITNRGGRTCHAAIVARELGIPAVVGTGDATSRLRDGQALTVSCAEGETGRVYQGALKFQVERLSIASIPRTRAKLQLNVGNPERAFALSFLPNDGVGLARLEFIISEAIKAHPMALLHPERVRDPRAREALEALTAAYPDKAEFFVDRLAQGVGTIAAAFYPKPVVVRLSDFKSNEYAALLGGADFEPREENPMIGLRGAARYTHPSYAEAFALECRAMRRVRGEMGLTNVRLMIPFCRRVEEGRRVLQELEKHGLRRGEDGLEVYVMCEIPNNVVCIDAFCALFDGISIGSNDLTQLTLGVDRDSTLVAFDFDERDPGVLELIRQAIQGAHRNRRHAGICGQAPSDYPEIAEHLVRLGIDSISLNADSLLRTTLAIAALERSLGTSGPALVTPA